MEAATNTPNKTYADNYLTLIQAKATIEALGFKVSNKQMRRWAGERKLPFFKWGKFLYIEHQELVMGFKRLQLQAVKDSRH